MPSRPASLFDDLPPIAANAQPDNAAALSVQPQARAAALSAAAKAFHLQLKRIDKLKSQLLELDTLGQSHRRALHETIMPLEKRKSEIMREMTLWLDQRLAVAQGLSAPQRETARKVVCAMARSLARGGETDMVAVHDRHSKSSLVEVERAEVADMRKDVEATLGESLDDLPPEASVEDLMRASMERMRQAMEAEELRRQAAADKRKARKKPSAAQAAVAAQLEDAQTWLRTLFRQLASALHPDREPDAQARLAKTALMSEANAAYGRKDLVALMQIQQRAELVDPGTLDNMNEDRLSGLTQLLKQQVAELERQRATRQTQLGAEFDLPWGISVDRHGLHTALLTQKMGLESEIAVMQLDLVRVREDAGLKRWLNQQRQLNRGAERQNRLLDSFDLGSFDEF